MIEINNLTLSYKKHKNVLENINLTLPKGQIIGLIGMNGAGKSSLLKAIMGFIKPIEGQILVDHFPPKQQYDKLVFITEEGSCPSFLDSQKYGSFLQKFYDNFSEERYNTILDFFEVDRKIPFAKLSKGQKAKVEIAAGFSKGGTYILMDEPFLGKDVFSRKDFLKLIATQIGENETILIATHELNEMEHFLDRVIILHEHQIAKDYLTDETESSLMDVFGEIIGYDAKRYQMLL